MTLVPKADFLSAHAEEVRGRATLRAAQSTLAGLAQCVKERKKYTFFFSHDEDDHDWFECEADSQSEAWAKAEAHVGGGVASRTLWLREVRPL